MSTALQIPWHRYALIAELSKRVQGVSPQFGKTALQKLVYLLQVIYGVDCGYDFQLYSYGPFAPELLGDLDTVEQLGCVTVQSARPANQGYLILPTEKVEALHKRATAFIHDPTTTQSLDALVHTFGTYTARDLELRATIVFVERDIRRNDEVASLSEVCRVVGEIKPKFTPIEIQQAALELARGKNITLASH